MDVKAALEVIQLDVTQHEQMDAAAEWVKDMFGNWMVGDRLVDTHVG